MGEKDTYLASYSGNRTGFEYYYFLEMADTQKLPAKQAKQAKQPKQPKQLKQPKQNNKNAGANSQQGKQSAAPANSGAAGKPSGPFSPSDLNRIVLEYLNKKGYHQTEAMLRAESDRTTAPQGKQVPVKNVKISKDVKPIVPVPDKNNKAAAQQTSVATGQKRDSKGNVISYEQAQMITSPESYMRAYKILKEWVDSSLEMYKEELNYIIYPIFIYVFLKLVSKSPIHARGFFDKYSTDFRVLHSTEINRLFSVNSVDHIKENEIANAFHSNKYRVTMSKTTLNLLLYFLNESENTGGSLIISVLNQNIEPNIVETITSKEKLSDGIKIISDDGKTNLDSDINSIPVKLGKFPHDEEFVKEIETELRILDEKERQHLLKDPSKSSQPKKKSMLQEFRILHGNFSNEKNDETNDDTNGASIDGDEKSCDVKNEDKKINKVVDRLESPFIDSLPLPPKTALDLKLEIQRVKETRDSIPLGNLQLELPSVCMYTFQNTNREMLSLDFSNDCRLAAAGFQDSYIKIWSLDGSTLENESISKSNSRDSNIQNKRKNQDHINTSTKFIGHSGAIYSTSFSPDNKLLLSGSEDKTVRLWSMDTQTALVSYKGHNHPIWNVKFSPMGHYFATASHDQTARLWSCDHIYPLRIFSGHLSDVDCIAFHPNGCYIFTGSSDKTCRMWDVQTGESIRLFLGHTSPITSLSVSPDGRWLSTGGDDGVINVWDISSGKRLKQMRGHGKNAIHSLSYNREGNILVSGGNDNSVRIWDLMKTKNEHTYITEPESEYDQPVVGYFGNPIPYINQDIKEFGRRNTVVPTTDLVASFYTKKTPVFNVQFTRSNLIFAGGVLRE